MAVNEENRDSTFLKIHTNKQIIIHQHIILIQEYPLQSYFSSYSGSTQHQLCWQSLIIQKTRFRSVIGQLCLATKKIIYSCQQFRMSKIRMQESLKDFQNVVFEHIPSVQLSDYGSPNHSVTSEILPDEKIKCFSRDQTNKAEQSVQKSRSKLSIKTQGQRMPSSIQLSDPQIEFKSKKLSEKYHRRKLNCKLKDAVFTQKVNKLKVNFIQKLKRNAVSGAPIEYHSQQTSQKQNQSWLNFSGIQISQTLNTFLNILFVLNIIVTLFLQTLSIVFKQIIQSKAAYSFHIIGIVVYVLQIVLNLITVRITLGKKLQNFREISRDYIHQSFYIDIINIIIILLNLVTCSSVPVLNVCKIFILLKFPDWMQRIKKLQVQFIQNYYKEHYWSLAKVFLFNFLYAHILSIVLLSMAKVNQNTNWLIVKGYANSPWYEQYIWSYYWSTTVMLTIGFGDIIPTCYQQALVMIFIEIISCIILAYNINCVGTLISNIRSQSEQKHRNLKIFKKLVEKNKLTEELSWKINSYIEEHSNIKKKSNLQAQAKFVQNLPPNYKLQYLKQSNRSIFKKVYFFSNLTQRTLCELSENIKAKIAHPLELLLNKDTNFDLLILKKGQIACKSNNNRDATYRDKLFNVVDISAQDYPFLLQTNFITKQRSCYKIISTVYSLLYYLEYQKLIQLLSKFTTDYEVYCQLRDKCKYYVDEFQVFVCGQCKKTRHTDFTCPKYHYLPFKEHVVHKELTFEKTYKNQRDIRFDRKKDPEKKFFIYLPPQDSQTQTPLQQKSKQSYRKLIKSRERLSKIIKKTKENTNKEGLNSQQNNLFCEKALQIVKQEMMRLLRQKEGEDSVWLIESDQMKNYKNYFQKDNPNNLSQKFSIRKRMKPTETTDFHEQKQKKTWQSISENSRKQIIQVEHQRRFRKLTHIIKNFESGKQLMKKGI